jgi:hypothetical protein
LNHEIRPSVLGVLHADGLTNRQRDTVKLMGAFLQLTIQNAPKLNKEVRLIAHIIKVSEIHSYLFHLRNRVEDFNRQKCS